MRHGSGPGPVSSEAQNTICSSSDKTGDVDAIVAQMHKLSTKNEDRGQRLGCYFCSDVVAPIDVLVLEIYLSTIFFFIVY